MACHPKIAARFDVVLDTVRRAPPQGLERRGFDSPQIAVIDGLTKKSGEKLATRSTNGPCETSATTTWRTSRGGWPSRPLGAGVRRGHSGRSFLLSSRPHGFHPAIASPCREQRASPRTSAVMRRRLRQRLRQPHELPPSLDRENRPDTATSKWARLVSNQRPLACEA
jgi:hypothetical protein